MKASRMRNVVVGMATVVIPSIVLAAVLPASFVLDAWTSSLKKTKTLHIKMEVTSADNAVSEEEIWIDKPSNFRRTIKNGQDRIDVVVTPSRAYKISKGKAEVIPFIDALGAVGLFYAADSLRTINIYLRQAGVDTDITRWVLKGKLTQWEAGKPEGPSISFLKEEWVPTGVSLSGKSYLFTTTLPSRFPVTFPDFIETLNGKTRTEQARTVSVLANTSIPDSIFDINSLRGTTQRK